MADVSKIKLGLNVYNVKDDNAVKSISINSGSAIYPTNGNINISIPTTTKVTVSGTGSVSLAMDSNKFYVFSNVSTLTLTLNAGTDLEIYAGKFTTSSSGCSVVLPVTVTTAPNIPTIEASKTYEFSIVDNIFVMIEV